MRILFISGKGSVGKTSLCAATGARLAELGYRTVVMSVDPAHSLTEAFDLRAGVFNVESADPFQVADRLSIHEVNVQKEIKRNWHGIWSYISSLWHTSGMSEVEAEEMATLPGMGELSALLYINEWHKEKRYDVIVLDCAPTAESVRFISLPTTMKWYLANIAPVQRRVLRTVRPIVSEVGVNTP